MRTSRPKPDLSVLFSHPMGAPLFTSPSDLARSIYTLPRDTHSFSCASVTSLASFLAQIARRKRAIPGALLAAIELAAHSRAKERNLPPIVTTRLLNEMESTRTTNTEESILRPEALLERQQRAQDLLILNAIPLELTETEKSYPLSAEFQQSVLSGFARGQPTIYGVDTVETAHRLWRTFFAHESRADPDHAEERWRELHHRQLLRIFLAPHWLLLTPTVALNRQRPDRYEAYIWEAPYNWSAVLPLVSTRRSMHLESMQELLATSSFIEPPKNT